MNKTATVCISLFLLFGQLAYANNIQSEWFDQETIDPNQDDDFKANTARGIPGNYKYSLEDGNPEELWGEENEKPRKKENKKVSSDFNKIIVQRINFPVSEYNQINREGNGAIKGKIRILKKDGKIIIARSSTIYLNPVTSYSQQWYDQAYMEGHKLSTPDQRLFQYIRFTSSDPKGNYRFDKVPQGEYFISCKIDCEEGCGEDQDEVLYLVDHAYAKDNSETEKDLLAEE